ncbi:Zn-ribbon domain-containing OB-fold protein [Nonomuraea sp. NPDC050536]|uniref:Zn-ribbon domain-containing OB-fold protein n=1 Tax=Nonomuraea sp. NPDC050536 TaxID=3364366 RepID=UPI0037C81767
MRDRDSSEWWDLVARHELAVQRCDGCGTLRFPPRAFCPACRTEQWEWHHPEPLATVESWITSHRPFPEGTVVRVRLSDAPHCVMYGTWEGADEPRPGESVIPVFTPDGLIHWRP